MGQAGRATLRRNLQTGSRLTSPLLRLRPKSITRSMLRFRTSVTVLIRGPPGCLLHPLRPLRPLDPLDSPLGSQPPHLLLRQLPARATIHGIRRSLRPRSHRRRNRPKPTRGTSHISSLPHDDPWNQPQGNHAWSGGSAARRRPVESASVPDSGFFWFLRQCRQYVGR